MVKETVHQILNHPLYDQRLFWYRGLGDDDLDLLYKQAYLVIESSFYEGFGLPVAEALKKGCVTLSADRGALPEAGGEFAIYFDPENSEDLYEKVLCFLENKAYYQKVKSRIQYYKGITWKQSASQVIQILDQIN